MQLLEQLTQDCAAGGSQPSPAPAAVTEAPFRALLIVAAATVATAAAVGREAREGGVAPPPAWGLKQLAEGTPGFLCVADSGADNYVETNTLVVLK